MVPILLVAIFLATLGLIWSGMYFFVETPLARRRMMTRLTAVQETSLRTDSNADLLRKDLLSDMPWLNQGLAFLPGMPELRLFLDQAGLQMQVGSLVMIDLAILLVVLAVGLGMGFPGILCGMVAMIAASLPFLVISGLRQRRFRMFDEQFPDCIDLLARAVRAGHAFTTGFEMIGKELPEPLAGEFRTAFRQQNLGLPLTEALANLSLRMPSADVKIFVSAIQIQRECGGNLAEILDTLSSVIRERYKLQRQVRVYTAEGRLSMYMLSGLPILTVIGFSLFKPGYLTPLFTDPRGHIAIAVVIVLQVVGYFVISRIIKIKV